MRWLEENTCILLVLGRQINEHGLKLAADNNHTTRIRELAREGTYILCSFLIMRTICVVVIDVVYNANISLALVFSPMGSIVI